MSQPECHRLSVVVTQLDIYTTLKAMTVYELTGGCCDTRLEFGFPTAPDFPATTTKTHSRLHEQL